MQIEVATALAIGAVVFAAGGGWITLSTTATRGREQGKRIGKLEIEVAELRGEMVARADLGADLRTRRRSLPSGIPVVRSGDDPTE